MKHQDEEPTWVTRITPLEPQDCPLHRVQVNVTPTDTIQSRSNYVAATNNIRNRKNDNCLLM